MPPGGGVSGDGGTSGGSDPFGSGPGGGSGTTDPLGSSPTSATASTGVASLLPNIQAWFDEWIAKSANSLNQILNTGFYGTVAAGGIIVCLYGFYLMAKDLPGPLQGVGDALALPGAVMKVGAKAASAAGKVAALA